MSKKQSIQGRFLAWLNTAPIGEAELMLGLVKEQLKQRSQKAAPAQAATLKRKRKAKTNAAGAGTQTSFSPEAMETAN